MIEQGLPTQCLHCTSSNSKTAGMSWLHARSGQVKFDCGMSAPSSSLSLQDTYPAPSCSHCAAFRGPPFPCSAYILYTVGLIQSLSSLLQVFRGGQKAKFCYSNNCHDSSEVSLSFLGDTLIVVSLCNFSTPAILRFQCFLLSAQLFSSDLLPGLPRKCRLW